MEYFVILAFLVLVGIQNILCVIIGLKIGLALRNGESLPNPIESYKEHRAKNEAKKEAKKEQDKFDTILKNIDSYDGTGFGQLEVPRG